MEAGDDPRPLGVDVRFVPGGWLLGSALVGELGQVVACGGQVRAVDVEPVDRPGRNGGGAGDRVEVGGGLQVGGDPAGGQHVEQVLADARIDVADDGVLVRVEPVVPPSPAGTTR